ncbi:mechanosensitive ion channel protein MscS [Marinobacterium nitratireducens]|uniref:Mechanosensitive ion channel protein MscS n=1 Tax=Marinobacterium nitratireducens TaxID=518897 RepID=A0A917ZCH0_9GAMM|nr:mechanosensitive ion channel family protein [Marinobacterium nitratireducens]GGO80556.1 mechanosensitive ion channel protein MscS [Marinobacterium nitratireducens]
MWQEFIDQLLLYWPFGPETRWVIPVFLIVFLTMLTNYLSNRMFGKLHDKLARTRNIWDDLLLDSARRPVAALVWVFGAGWALEVIDRRTGTHLMDVAEPLRRMAVILLITWFLVRLIKGAEQALVSPEKVKAPMDLTTASAIGKLLRLSVIITAVLVVLQSFGYSISGVLAFGGIGGIAVGFAAKDLLSNFFGGLMIYLDRPFKVGDWIRSPDQNIEGTVEDIGWRQTRIRTFDKRPLYVPNATFASISVENPSRMTHRRIYETVGVRYDDIQKVERIIDDVRQMLAGHPEIDQTQTLMVNFNAFGPSSLDFFLYTFTRTVNWEHFHKVKQDVLLKVADIIDAHGAEIAYPTRTLHLASMPEGAAPAVQPEPAAAKS